MDLVDFIRTSLVKNPEEWVFEETVASTLKIPSFLHIFRHVPTKYKLLLIEIPPTEIANEWEVGESHHMNVIPERDYNKHVRDNDGAFFPEPTEFLEIHSGSVILKVLYYIRDISKIEEDSRKYSRFKEHMRERYFQNGTGSKNSPKD